MTLARPPEWTRDAACLGLTSAGRDLWHPDDGHEDDWVLARPICAACPVRLSCATDALRAGLEHGMYGGLTPADRRAVARVHGFPRPGAAPHGTRSRFVAGCTAGPEGRSCDPCRAAHAAYERERRAIRRERRAEPWPWLTTPVGSGRHRGWPGQYVLLPSLVPPPALIGAAA